MVGILTGIFTAIKIAQCGEKELFEAFNLTYTLKDLENFSSNFFGRFFSCELVVVILLGFSFTPYLYFFGFCLLAYRSFLISINSVMIIITFSISGILKILLIILPCQLLMIFAMIGYFVYSCSSFKINKYLKCKKLSPVLLPFLIVSLVLIICNILETLLLFIFKSNVILVI